MATKLNEFVLAAEYVRMSDDHQQYSIANQSAAIHAYANRRGMRVVRTYADEGKSGVILDRRAGLRRLIEDVLTGTADFKVILVFDVSRWGRFQDPDEAAYHEFVCKRAGISVHYCAEQFENDGSPLAAAMKNMKRAMAGEYSRDLSDKVFAGHVRFFHLGFRQGASAPFGMRRLLIDAQGTPKFVLEHRQRKSIQNDRVILVPGPVDEIETVRWIFSIFVKKKMPAKAIVRALNANNVNTGIGRPWGYHKLNRLLQNEIYIGNYVWNRCSIKLGTQLTPNDPEKWLRRKCDFGPIVDPRIFERAQRIIRKRLRRLTDDEKLEPLRRLLRKHGYLDAKLIERSRRAYSAVAYAKWFGSLRNTYKLIGYTGEGRSRPFHVTAPTDEQLLDILRNILRENGTLSETIINGTKGAPSSSFYRKRFGSVSRAYELIGFRADPNTPRGRAQITFSRSNAQLLDSLSLLLRKHGRLSTSIIRNSDEDVPSEMAYRRRFGSLGQAYALIGYVPKR